jgi:peptidoglycan biosynthesis protein MviN/MurJ (putative lipid II flippase)
MVTPIVALGILFYGLNVIISNVLFVKLKTVAIFKINIIAAIINVSFNLVVCYFIRNILVAAVSTLLSYLVAFIFIQRFMSIDWPIDYNYKMIIKSLAASVMMAYVLYGISTWLGDDALRLSYIIGEIIVGIVIYFLSILLLRTFSSEELAYLKKIMVKGDR